MPKYTFNKKSDEPSDELIRSKMDFNKILQKQNDINNYKLATKPLYKKPLFLGFMILLGVIVLVLIFDEVDSDHIPVKPLKDSVVIDSLKK